MIKARMTRDDGRPLFLFGLSAMNLSKLRGGQPIVINLEEMDGVGEVVIMFGETEQAITAELADLIGPDTKVHGIKENGH